MWLKVTVREGNKLILKANKSYCSQFHVSDYMNIISSNKDTSRSVCGREEITEDLKNAPVGEDRFVHCSTNYTIALALI